MSQENVWYLGKRAAQLAFVYLSRRSDLIVTEQSPSVDYGLDYLVSLVKDGEYTGRMFGVEVKARKSNSHIRRSSSDEAHINIKEIRVPRDIPFPVCLFVFIMETDEGYFKWLKKPVYGEQSYPQLLVDKSKSFRKLENGVLDDIVAEINKWYDSKLKIPA